MKLCSKMFLVSLAVLFAVLHAVTAKQFERCELVRKLKSRGITENLPNWVCAIENESSRKTDAINKHNSDGSWDYGIFQINSRYWCKNRKRGGDCNIRCENLIDSNIDDDIQCAKKIYNRHGFSAWFAWVAKCKGKALPSLAYC